MQEFIGLFMFVILAFLFSSVIVLGTTIGNFLGKYLSKFLQADKEKIRQEENAGPQKNKYTHKSIIKFFIGAVLSVIFFGLIIMLVPFAVVYGNLGKGAFLACAIFVGIALFAIFYAQRKNSLKWKI